MVKRAVYQQAVSTNSAQYMCVHLKYLKQISHARFWQITTYHLQTETKAAMSLFYNPREVCTVLTKALLPAT